MNTLFRIISAVQRTASNACQSNGVHHSLRKGAIGRCFNDPPAARNIGCTPLSADVGHISSQSCWCKKQNTSSFYPFVWRQQLSWHFHIFGDILHWVSLLQRHFHCLISGLAATRACASISGSACNQLVD